MNQLLSRLEWRYATKKFDPARPAAQEQVDRIVEAIRLAPTSSGLQPYDLIVVSDPALRARIKPVANDQQQIADCSHLLVFAAWDDMTPTRIDKMFDLVNTERGFVNEGWEAYRKVLLSKHAAQGRQANFEFAARQAYIGLGTGIVAAAMEGVDATPMEGFDPAGVDRVLGLEAMGLRSVSMLALGHRDADGDWLVKLKKVRRSREDFVLAFG
ncbi:NAD(P)H-dependent oxidoreductase [Massilia sp. CFBP9012]|uniref:NAD(P)H-dependent oxidoreductase n=1 Tax=Massilia sp. CFBP9012 TaxID=3096531 RepID=UPI002A69F0F1|nr:NAD(P)H-dependent oxidoreductase [Massilia sp. CFBP9012]MDY0974685.1 NAD(P)H-dependent oxidoreductase [Massilia sp. CFBP9012]